jgi:hypothetical protein
VEAGLEDMSPGNRMEVGDRADWVIWPGPERGYVALSSDLPLIADALEALWSLRAEQRQIDTFLAARGWVLGPGPGPGPGPAE